LKARLASLFRRRAKRETGYDLIVQAARAGSAVETILSHLRTCPVIPTAFAIDMLDGIATVANLDVDVTVLHANGIAMVVEPNRKTGRARMYFVEVAR
jgi:hypothetical protein